MPMPRKSLVLVDTTPSYHVVSRCVHRTFLATQTGGCPYRNGRSSLSALSSSSFSVVFELSKDTHPILTLTFQQP